MSQQNEKQEETQFNPPKQFTPPKEPIYEETIAVWAHELRLIQEEKTGSTINQTYDRLDLLADRIENTGRHFQVDETNKRTIRGLLGQVFYEISMCAMQRGFFKDARRMLEEALDRVADVYGVISPMTFQVQFNLSVVCYQLGEIKEAEEWAKCALDVGKEIYGGESLEMGSTFYQRAQCYLALNNVQGALTAGSFAAGIFEAALGKHSPQLADALALLGSAQRKVGGPANLLQALLTHQRAKGIRQSIFGKKSAAAAMSCNSIGMIYRDLGRFQEAERELQHACIWLQVAVDAGETQHMQALCIANFNLADIYNQCSAYEQAYHLATHWIGPAIEAFGETHPQVEYFLSVENAARLGRIEQAIDMRKSTP